MAVLMRALVYAALFIGLFLIFIPARLVTSAGLAPPESTGILQIAGLAMTAAGAAIALSCILTFALLGRGTPAPFDPPRRLVVRGPYRYVRNPMYIGAGLVLIGAAAYYESPRLVGYAAAFMLIAHLFVVLYEEPTLSRSFGREYDDYRRCVARWWPSRAQPGLRTPPPS
jgi:protein-S-isoprenylcysteine O-methyltransferase Ste14